MLRYCSEMPGPIQNFELLSSFRIMKSVTRQIPILYLKKSSVTTFLCSLFPRSRFLQCLPSKSHGTSPRRKYSSLHVASTTLPDEKIAAKPLVISRLPWTCPGCGAFTQLSNPDEAGFYSSTRKSVKALISSGNGPATDGSSVEAQTFERVVANANQGLLQSLGLDGVQGRMGIVALRSTKSNIAHPIAESAAAVPANLPICDRCHDLLHHHKGVSIIHPSLQSIQDIFAESPHKYNHIYHVLDAADFPLSLIPSLQQHLSLMSQRGQNRRAKLGKFYHGQKSEMSFIITRSDLLAPKKEQVDALMPYLLQVLRNALGSLGKAVRLGNVRCVSSKRGWWTRELREDIWKRGGGGWMVGKVNVGKSNLFETVFPKGRNEETNFGALRHSAVRQSNINGVVEAPPRSDVPELYGQHVGSASSSSEAEFSEDLQRPLLLPPAPVETAFPVMPIVSSLPGTTASPIRLLFGNGRGELVDLPGLARGNLESYVRNEHKLDLVMRHRIKAKQYVIKSGQSLLVGGLIRITPRTPEVVLLACPFVPLHCHVTSTDKAAAIHTQQVLSGIPTITTPSAGQRMASAGVFELAWDVTKQRAGPLTAPSAVGLKPHVLPFVIFSADILIEGCGWIELAIQMRKRALESADGSREGVTGGRTFFPTVEVFSPEGKHIGIRQPMNAWMLGGDRPLPASKRTARPRRSMKGVKKNLKKVKRAMAGSSE